MRRTAAEHARSLHALAIGAGKFVTNDLAPLDAHVDVQGVAEALADVAACGVRILSSSLSSMPIQKSRDISRTEGLALLGSRSPGFSPFSGLTMISHSGNWPCYARDVLRLPRMISLIHPENSRSLRVAERFRAQREDVVEVMSRPFHRFAWPISP